MGVPQERSASLTEKRAEVSLRRGAIRIPFRFGRQPVANDAMRASLDVFAIAGAKVVNPSWSDLTDEEIKEELDVTARHPLDKAPYQALGVVLSEQGFNKYERPFRSFDDNNLRNLFRAIADPIVKEPYYTPAQIARAVLFNPDIKYQDDAKREWDSGELASHLTIALAERGRPFNTKYDEHAPRISSVYRWPADLAEMLCIGYLLGEGKIEEDIKHRVLDRMKENLDTITDLARLSDADRTQIAVKANELAGAKVIT
ncbi:MAG TPA: hypothetical protein VM077_05115 [Candidatus Limnocylindrales bacterium]|nr:hypothetical protein [Candidatus Limnocylindrales bacterium]